jgi:hypothetical protein
MSNYYDTQTTMDNALRTICYLCEENSKIRADLEAMKRVHEDAMHIIGSRNEEIANLKEQISDLNYELDVVYNDHEDYDDEDDDEDECPSVSARNPNLNGTAVTEIILDPPSGWKYGFPKTMKDPSKYNTHPNRDMNAWLFANGYPLEEIAIWVPKDKQKAKMSFDYVLNNAEVPFRTQRFPSGNQS